MLSVPQRYRRTDGRTDGRTTYDSNTALALRASRGKREIMVNLYKTLATPQVQCCMNAWSPHYAKDKEL